MGHKSIDDVCQLWVIMVGSTCSSNSLPKEAKYFGLIFFFEYTYCLVRICSIIIHAWIFSAVLTTPKCWYAITLPISSEWVNSSLLMFHCPCFTWGQMLISSCLVNENPFSLRQCASLRHLGLEDSTVINVLINLLQLWTSLLFSKW